MKPQSYGPFPYSPIISRPRLEWPNGAHVALWIIPNIEYFSLEERPGGYGPGKVPDVVMWSERDYGNRVGVFRIMETLDRYGIRARSRSTATCAPNTPPSWRKARSANGNGWVITRATRVD